MTRRLIDIPDLKTLAIRLAFAVFGEAGPAGPRMVSIRRTRLLGPLSDKLKGIIS